MISRVLIIGSGGILLYSKSFFVEEKEEFDNDLISGFLTAISSFAQEIKGGNIKALNFRNFNFVYAYDDRFGCMFVVVTAIDDLEEEAHAACVLMKKEFITKYESNLEHFTGNITDFKGFDDFIKENIYIPPKVLLTGEVGVGKTTIMNLFPGETVLELDEDLNEIIQKPIGVSGLENLKEFMLREIDLDELVSNSKLYRNLLDSVEIICIVTNSAGSNLSRTKKLYDRLKPKIKKGDIYVVANFQDRKEASFEPVKIEEAFGVKTYGYSAIQDDSKKILFTIFTEILKISVLDKLKSKPTPTM